MTEQANSANPLSLPRRPPASREKLRGGREFSDPHGNPSTQQQGHPHLQLVSGLAAGQQWGLDFPIRAPDKHSGLPSLGPS